MPNHEMKTRIVLEGEQQYRAAMNDAANANKVLNSEMKLAKAQFEANGDAQQYAAEQARILKEQIENQKRAVKAAEDAIKELTDKGVDKNAAQMQQWRTKLNNARTSLARMESSLDKVGKELGEEQTEFGKTETSAENFGNKMDEVSRAVKMEQAISAINTVTEQIENLVKGAARAAKAFWDMGVDAGNWADDLVSAAQNAGIDVETYQSWQYASRIIDTSVDDIVKNWKDIDAKLATTGDTFYEYAGGLTEMGVAVRDSSGNMRQGKDVFWDIIESLHNMGDESAWAGKAMELFGNDWRKLNPLIEAGALNYLDVADEARGFAVVSEQNVKALASLDDKTEKLEKSFDTLKYDTLAALADTFNIVADALQTAISALNEFVNSEEGQRALSELNTALSGLIESFLGEDNGQGTFESIVTAAKGAVENFTSALSWIEDHSTGIVKTIEGLGAAWATLKVTKEVLTFMQLLSAMPLDKLKAVFGSGTASAEDLAAKTGSKVADAASKSASQSAAKAASDAAVKSAESAAAAAESAAAASAESAAASSEAAVASSAASSQAAIDAGAASAAAAESAASAAIESANASKIAAQSAASAAITSGAGSSLPNLTLKFPTMIPYKNTQNLIGGNPLALPSGQSTGALPAAASAASSALSALLSSGALKALGGFGAFAGTLLSPTPTASDDWDVLFDEMGELTAAGREYYSTAKEAADNLDGIVSDIVDIDMSALARKAALKQAKNPDDILALMQDENWTPLALPDAWYVTGQEAAENLEAAIEDALPDISGASESVADAVAGEVEPLENDMEIYGENAAVAFANGIMFRSRDAANAARTMAGATANIVKTTMQIHSPSRVMRGLGEYVGLGFAEGISESSAAVDAAVGKMLSATARRPSTMGLRFSGAEGSAVSGAPSTVHVTLMVDDEVLGETVAPIVNQKLGAAIAAKRR